MGLLRILLALSVVISHSGAIFGYNLLDAHIAVCSFFIISGFYMALVLDKKYANKSKLLFISNRFLRIFPSYLAILFATLIFILVKYYLHIGSPDNAISFYITNTKLTGGDQILNIVNLIFRNLTLIITTDYFFLKDTQAAYLLVPQAWSLQTEFIFYLLAPFIVRLPKKFLLLGFALYLGIFFGFIFPRHILFAFPVIASIGTYFIYFALGILAYRFIYQVIQKQKNLSKIAITLFIILIGYILLYQYIPFKSSMAFLSMDDVLYFVFLTISIPFIFWLTKKSSLDRLIGEFSYPLYICHWLVYKLVSNLFSRSASDIKTILIVVLSFIATFVLIRCVEKPIEKFRQRRVKAK